MRLNNLDLNLLIYLDALLTEQSVSRAARRVFITQPSMSDALARLRDYFQDKLLVQVGKAMVPTPVAQSLIQPVRNILIQIQSVVSSTRDFDPAQSNRKITIMVADYTVDVLLNQVTPRLWREAPGIQIEYVALRSDFQEQFDRGVLDLLIVPQTYMSDEHPRELLYREQFTCAVWSGNRMVGETISFEEYKSMGHVCVNLGEWRTPTYEQWFMERYGKVRRIEVVVPSFGMALQQIPGTLRITTCHLRHAQMYEKRYSLRLLKPPVSIPPLKQCIQWHKYRDRDPALIWFRSLLRQAASEM
jgi:DNA-binding transcriptional LysR family regulator